MTTRDVRNKCQIELNAKSDGAYDTFVDEELDEFISLGIRQFYARRLSGFTSDRTSFEQWQKRSDDLRCVYTREELDVDHVDRKNKARIYSYAIPTDYWHMLSEDVDLINTKNMGGVITNDVVGTYDVFECTTDNITARLNNTLGEHIYDKGKLRPLRLYVFDKTPDPIYGASLLEIPDPMPGTEIASSNGDDVFEIGGTPTLPAMKSKLYMVAPENISLGKYTIEYIRKPNEFGLYSNEYKADDFDEDAEITQIPDYAWDEVLAIAIKHALENSSSYRIQTYNSERAEIQ